MSELSIPIEWTFQVILGAVYITSLLIIVMKTLGYRWIFFYKIF
jgi:hypothetical protein